MTRRITLVVAVAAILLGSLLAGASHSASVPPAPTGVAGVATESAVTVAWQPVAGASSYVVLRGTTPTSIATAVTPAGGVTTQSFTDASAVDGTTYYYVVHAVAAGVQSIDSLVVQATPVHRACSTGNPVVLENCYPGNTPWDVRNTATVAGGGIEGYATAQSIDAGQSLDVKVNATTGATFNIEVYRTGYYGGAEARLFSIVRNVAAVAQPACTSDSTTGLLSCSNWSVSATISTTTDWPSGVYVLRLVRNDNGTDNQVLFVVRNDERPSSDIVYGEGMATLQAYNNYGGKSLYDFNSSGNATVSGTARAVKVSYDRPFEQPRSGLRDWYTRTEIATVAWLEQSGYDVTYVANTDLESRPGILSTHKVYISPAHDEYVSGGMRSAMTSARDSGVNLFISGSNAVYWKIRFESDPATGAPGRVQVCYKSTQSGGSDPSGIPTGTWRDPAGANQPENGLIGIMYVGDNDGTNFPLVVNANQGADRVFRFTGLDAQALGSQTSIGTSLVGWEWDAPFNNGAQPAGLVQLSGSPASGELIQGNGATTTPGSAVPAATKYKAASGALVFATGTNNWNRALAPNATGSADLDSRIQQVTVNVLEDMGGVVPSTPAAGIKLDSGSAGQGPGPTGVTATALGSDSIQISWNPVAGASGYNVYRALAPRSGGLPLGALANPALVTGTTFTDISLSATTTYDYVVTAVTNGSQSAVSTEAAATTAAAAGQPTRLEVGSTRPYTSSTGATFAADNFVTGGNVRVVPTLPIAGTNDPTLFQSERWGQFTYAIPVTNGTYNVRFEFAETFYTGACTGKRIFGMDVLNTAASPDLSNIDICAAVGPATAYIRTVTGVAVTNGTLTIKSVYGSIDDPTLEALEIIPQSSAPPTVSSTSPVTNAVGVPVSAAVQATFSRAMDSTTLNASTVTLASSSGNAVAAAVTYDTTRNVVTLTPSAALAFSTTYTAQISAAARGADGIALAAPYSWSFTTAPPAAPAVTAVRPADGAAGVSTASVVSAVFSTALDPASVSSSTFTLTSPDGAVIDATYSYAAATQTATLTPTAVLATGTTYTARLTTGVMGSGGVALPAPFVWSFTTAAPVAAPPVVTATTPSSAASGVGEQTSVTATFSEVMDGGTLTPSTFTLVGPTGPVGAAVTFDATTATATLTPVSPLAVSSTYTASIATGVRAADGTPLAAPFSWSFTTSSAPTVVGITPSAGNAFVSRATAVRVAFSRPMNAATLTTSSLTLSDASGATVGAAVSYDSASQSATLQPTGLLQGGSSYTARVDGGVTAADGAPLGAPTTWSFTTAACPCSLHSLVSTPASQNLPTRDGRSGTGPWSYELGVKVTVDEPTDLTALRFFKTSAETGTHVGRVWTSTGTQLTSVTFSSESASGWQSQALPAPLVLQPGTVYIVSVNANAFFADTSSGLTNALVAGPLRTVADGANGSYGASAGTFPNQSFHSADYFVDVLVVPDGTPAVPTVVSTSPVAGATSASVRAPITVSFSRSMDPSSITSSTLTLRAPDGSVVPATVAYSATTNAATMTPVAQLAFDTTFTATVSGSVRAADGMPLGNATTWSFHTALQQAALAVSSVTPTAGTTGAQTDTTVQITFNRDVDPTTLTKNTVQLVPAGGTAIATTITYSPATFTATVKPTSALAQSTAYTVQLTTGILAATDGTPLPAPASWSFTTGLCPCSLFAPTLQPTVTKAAVQDGRTGAGPWSYEMGVKFTVSQPAQLAAIRFYKALGELGTHTGTLWTASGVKIATVGFTNETASGWQQANLASPVTLQPGTVYVVSVGLNAYYVSTRSGMATQITSGVLQSVADGANGVYGASAGVFPTSSFSSSNYFVDLVIR